MGADEWTDVNQQARLRALGFGVERDPLGVLVISCPDDKPQLDLDLTTALVPVRIEVGRPNAIHGIHMPSGGHDCMVSYKGGTTGDSVEIAFASGDGRLILRLDDPIRIALGDGNVRCLRLETRLDRISPRTTQVTCRLQLDRVEVQGGRWTLSPLSVSGCELLGAELLSPTELTCQHELELRGRCRVGDGAILRAESLISDDIVSFGQAGLIDVERLGSPLVVVGEGIGLGRNLSVREGRADVRGSGPITMAFGTMREIEVDTPDGHLNVQRADRAVITAARVTVGQFIFSLSGRIYSLHSQRALVTCEADCRLDRIASADGGDLHNANPYVLNLGDIQALENARHVTFRFERGHRLQTSRGWPFVRWIDRHFEKLDNSPLKQGTVLWYRLGLLLDKHGGTGADRAIVRRTEHDFRRRSIEGKWWATPERMWLNIYRLVGYGDGILRPICFQVAFTLAMTLAVMKSQVTGVGRLWSVWWRLFVQPLRFFLRDEDALKLTGRLPNGWLSDFAPIMSQLAGAVLFAMSFNAIRRLVKAR